jgi:hypothetical protein
MTPQPIMGYIVYDEAGPLYLYRYPGDNLCPRGGVLVHNTSTTLFTSWNLAKNASDRTMKFSRRRKLDWTCNHKIKAVRYKEY